MRSTLISTSVVAALAAGSPALATEYEYTGPNGGDWNANNWFPTPGWPDDFDDEATIPAGKHVVVKIDTARTGIMVTDGPSGELAGGIIEIGHLGVLEFDDDSTINGEIRFTNNGCTDVCVTATLMVDNDGSPTVSGTGQIIGGDNHDSLWGGLISPHQNEEELTIAEGFTIRGHVSIDIGLTNNGTVIVDHEDDTLTLTEAPKSGSGKWACHAGLFEVLDAWVTGAASWELRETDSGGDAELHIGATAIVDDLSGPFSMAGGTFNVDSSFCTTGTAEIDGVSHDGIATRIELASGNPRPTIKFDAPSCP